MNQPDHVEMTDLTALIVVLARCYDLLAIIAKDVDPELSEEVLDEHEQGRLRMPFPYLVVPDDSME